MQYMCLIYSTEGSGPQPGTDEFGPFMQTYMDFTQKMKDEGKFIAGDALQPVATATTVATRDGKTEMVVTLMSLGVLLNLSREVTP